MTKVSPSPSSFFNPYMAEWLTVNEWNTPLSILKIRNSEVDFQPALPFIQDFENPLPELAVLTNSVYIGHYADYVSLTNMLYDDITSGGADGKDEEIKESKTEFGKNFTSPPASPATQSSQT